jgi:hypothetical protein
MISHPKTTTMKTTTLATTLLALIASPLAIAGADHDHDHKHEEHVTSGPNGGHVVQSKAGFSFEVTVDKERKARIVFLGKDNKPVALGEPSITGIAGERSAPVKLSFAKGADKDADVLIADKPLPAGAHIPMILSIKTGPDTKAVTERFELHLH